MSTKKIVIIVLIVGAAIMLYMWLKDKKGEAKAKDKSPATKDKRPAQITQGAQVYIKNNSPYSVIEKNDKGQLVADAKKAERTPQRLLVEVAKASGISDTVVIRYDGKLYATKKEYLEA